MQIEAAYGLIDGIEQLKEPIDACRRKGRSGRRGNACKPHVAIPLQCLLQTKKKHLKCGCLHAVEMKTIEYEPGAIDGSDCPLQFTQ